METKEILNRKARHDFEIVDTYEAGIELKGTEVKSLRLGNATLQGAFAKIDKGQVYMIGAHIQEYEQGNRFNHDPIRFRRLLLHKEEIRKLHQACTLKGCTLVPLKIYFSNRGLVKILLGVARGKNAVDKRDDIKKRDAEREMRMAEKKSRRR